ncbi:MAG: hypothetical protein Kow0069_08710 [Promethearchaeota archaeon]
MTVQETRLASRAPGEVKVERRPRRILEHLQLGTNIPVLPEFQKYVLRNLKRFDARALLFVEDLDEHLAARFEKPDDVTGICVAYDDGGDTLFFGFLGTLDHDPRKVDALIDGLLDLALSRGYKFVRGPINVPTVIFGWGFPLPGSRSDLFVGCPVAPPVYLERLEAAQFDVLFEEDRYRCDLVRFDPMAGGPLVAKYDYGDYEYFNPADKEEAQSLKADFVDLHAKFMPPSARITPNSAGNAEDIVDFVFEFGNPGMIWGVRHRPTGDVVACGYVIPNPFSRDKRGNLNSVSMHDWVVHPDHRRAGLAMLMYGGSSLRLVPSRRNDPHPERTFTWGSWPVGSENEANSAAARKMGGVRDRTHLIFQRYA